MMPETDGMTVLRSLQRQGRLPALPVVVVTAYDGRQRRLEALSTGAIDFLAKPINHLEVTSLLAVDRHASKSTWPAAERSQ